MKARNALLVSRVSICPRERYRTFRKTRQRYTLFHYAQRKRGKNLPQRDVFPPHPPVFAVKPISHDFYTRVSRNLYPGLHSMHTRVSHPLRPGYQGIDRSWRRIGTQSEQKGASARLLFRLLAAVCVNFWRDRLVFR